METERKLILRKSDVFDLLSNKSIKGRVLFIGVEYDDQKEFININIEVEDDEQFI